MEKLTFDSENKIVDKVVSRFNKLYPNISNFHEEIRSSFYLKKGHYWVSEPQFPLYELLFEKYFFGKEKFTSKDIQFILCIFRSCHSIKYHILEYAYEKSFYPFIESLSKSVLIRDELNVFGTIKDGRIKCVNCMYYSGLFPWPVDYYGRKRKVIFQVKPEMKELLDEIMEDWKKGVFHTDLKPCKKG